jgi:hypothetical protein
MRAVTITKALAAASANGIALSQSLAGNGALTLNGADASGGVATLDTQRRVLITSAGNDSGVTWTLIGTDETGNPIKDQFVGGNVAAVQSNFDFLTITSITGSAATASTVTVGTNTVGSSPWHLMDNFIPTPNLGIDMVLVSGAGNASFEYTYEAVLAKVSPNGANAPIGFAAVLPPAVVVASPLSNLTTTKDGSLNQPINAYRLTINSGTGTWRTTVIQSGVSSP